MPRTSTGGEENPHDVQLRAAVRLTPAYKRCVRGEPPATRNLRIPLPFEDALKAATEVKPLPETKRTGNGRKQPKKPAKG